MIRPILKYGYQILHEVARPVEAVTPDIASVIADMVDTMYAAPGIGLAATQIGIPLRIFVIDITLGRDPNGLPIGLQIAGRPFAEARVLRAVDAYQRDTDWHRRRPPVVPA